MSQVVGPIAAILYAKTAPSSAFTGVWVPCSTDNDPTTINGTPKFYNHSTSQWEDIVGSDGNDGSDGDSAYFYQASADDPNGLNFSYPYDPTQQYVAWLNTTTEIASPSASDFTGKWEQKGTNGLSVFLYRAYANDDLGTGFIVNPANPDVYDYRAEIIEYAYIAPGNLTQGMFSGEWYRQKGVPGNDGISVSSAAFSGNDIVFTMSDASTITLANAKNDLQGPSGNGYQLYPVAFNSSLNFASSVLMETVQSAQIAFDIDQTDFTLGTELSVIIEVDGQGISFGADMYQKNTVVPSASPGDKVLIEFKALAVGGTNTVFYNIYNI